ncbi:Exodeoxyribonuclease [candidate division SR1 bacterium Aalborg_AAW-1]|nr:Exodeoxyribonuclease [candidate division SR1 bacterium Aalborg_AAW-1]
MKIATRNVNGIRAIADKGFVERVRANDLDIVCIQEPKAFDHQIPASLQSLSYDYDYIWHAGTRPGYAGTAIFYKKKFGQLPGNNIFEGYDLLHDDGRITEVTIDTLKIINGYFPNGGSRADGTEMLSYKLNFYDQIIGYVQSLQSQGFQTIVTGDFNIVHTPIDIARPKENENTIGFLPIERAKIGSFIEDTNSLDMRRYLHPETLDHYTWWSYRAGARPRNVGRRIDYMMVDEHLQNFILSCEHQDYVMGSDHCPVVLELKD